MLWSYGPPNKFLANPTTALDQVDRSRLAGSFKLTKWTFYPACCLCLPLPSEGPRGSYKLGTYQVKCSDFLRAGLQVRYDGELSSMYAMEARDANASVAI